MAAQIKKLNLRIASTKNIGKITKSMKMVAASKLRGDQMRLEAGRPFGEALFRCLLPEEDRPSFGKKAADGDDLKASTNWDLSNDKTLLVAITSDRGLCGGVNSFVCKAVKAGLGEYAESGKDCKLISFGDKGRAQLQRQFAANYTYSIDENQKDPVNFTKICALSERVTAQDFDKAYVFFNRFYNSISYTTTRLPLPNFGNPELRMSQPDDPEGTIVGPAHLQEYEIEHDSKEELFQNLHEFGTAGMLFAGAIENATSEQSSRMTAMDNASTNAADMINSLTLKANRARQAAITTELIEIISGAAALDDAKD